MDNEGFDGAEAFKDFSERGGKDVNYRLQVFRLEPQIVRGIKIDGYLTTHHLPTTIPSIIESVGKSYGGGKFQIKVIDDSGKYVRSQIFEIAGVPKIPGEVAGHLKAEDSPNPHLISNAESILDKLKQLTSVPAPTREEIRNLIIHRTIRLLDKPGVDELDTLKFLKELYRGK